MRLTTRWLLMAGFATALFTGVGLATAAAAAPAHTDRVSDVASGADESLPGGDSTVPVAAFAVLLSSAGLAWVVRRSSPAPVAVTSAVADDLAPVADLSPRRPAGLKLRPRNPAAA